MSGQGALVWCPFPDAGSAGECARTVLAERLAACANLLPGMQSLFLWQGEISEAQETGVLFKTAAELLDLLIDRIGQLHPHDQPVILGWRCDLAHSATLAWLAKLPRPDLRGG
jgi:periplasmic divalent cation tolerance protein